MPDLENETTTTAEANLITTTVMKDSKIREVDFTLKFEKDLRKLIEALGVTRKVQKTAGTMLKTYVATGTLGNVNVDEGEIIPLSAYKIEKKDYKEITLQKRAKAASAEAITDYGFDQAVTMTSDKMLKDVANVIRGNLFSAMSKGSGVATGTNLQGVLADAWGQLQILFEDTDSAPVYFVNPLDIADYLKTAQITTQTAFGMNYVEDFLGLGKVFMCSSVEQGKIYATPQDNIVMYYIPVNGADLGDAFEFTTDPTGYIGIHEGADYERMVARDTVVWGIEFFAEKTDGVVVGTISAE